MSNIIRADDFGSPPSRRARRELERTREQEAVRQAWLDAQLRQELARTVGSEQIAFVQGERRLEYGEALTRKAMIKSAGLRQLASTLSQGDLETELAMRGQVSQYDGGAKLTIASYMTRP